MTAATELRNLARDIAAEAGKLASRMRQEGVEIAASKTTDIDIVTYGDQATEEFIRSKIADARPQDGFLGEEGGAQRGSSGLTWVIDPIDGTVNYLYGIPAYGVSIAVVEGDPNPASWTTLAGVVNNPAIGEMFVAARGEGSFLGKQRLEVAPVDSVEHTLLGTGFAYSSVMRARQARILNTLLPRVRDIRRIGACSLDLCSLAAGRLNAYYEIDLKPWDHAAGALIAREAGARIEGINGAKEGQDLLLAAHPAIFGEIHQLLLDASWDLA